MTAAQTGENPPFLLRFGIPSMDHLISGEGEDTSKNNSLPEGIVLEGDSTTSLCIVGPDGTGKSVLGLHMASRYAADCAELAEATAGSPCVFYISTDLNFRTANERLWKKFALKTPNARTIPFARKTRYGVDEQLEVTLAPVAPVGSPDDEASAVRFVNRTGTQSGGKAVEVGFLDLARDTAGDDWAYVDRLIALLPKRGKGEPKHLLVIDAVEGFETLVGEKDAFGEVSSRRSRLAQLMRLASGGEGKCHLVLIVEETFPDEKQAEVFITDFVIRLREVTANGYVRRTVQVEKARGYAHARGQHPFVIRSGRGSTTGAQENADDPRVAATISKENHAYVHVFRSLHRLSRTTMQKRGRPRSERPPGEYAAFGILHLDEMLGGNDRGDVARRNESAGGDPSKPSERTDSVGVPSASVTALIGDSETQKSNLGRAFLSRCFAAFPDRWKMLIKEIQSGREEGKLAFVLQSRKFSSLERAFRAAKVEFDEFLKEPALGKTAVLNQAALQNAFVAAWLLWADGYTDGEESIAVMLTSYDIDSTGLARDFYRITESRVPGTWRAIADAAELTLDAIEAIAMKYFATRTICRRLEIHDLSSPILMHIVSSSVQRAQSLQMGERPNTADDRWGKSKGIRLVIDDFNVMKNLYGEILSEALFLPYLMFYLRREGITTLIINTNPERSGTVVTDKFEQEFRGLADNRIFTWHVPFFGRDKLAIAVFPPLSEAGVRELAPMTREGDWGALAVDPRFELYSGLEDGAPKLVPLEIRLFEETGDFGRYIARENRLFNELFPPVAGRNAVICGQPPRDYEVLRDFCSIQNRRQLDHTLIFQVDEFWVLRGGALADRRSYLEQATSNSRKAVVAADPARAFQPSKADAAGWKLRREFFAPVGYKLETGPDDPIDRVPFTWDFGFLLCRQRCWEEAARNKREVGEVWTRLKKVGQPGGETVEWLPFLRSARFVADAWASRTSSPVNALDLSMLAPESFSCLVLEMWASAIFEFAVNISPRIESLSDRTWASKDRGPSLTSLLPDPADKKPGGGVQPWEALFAVWLMLAESMNLEALGSAALRSEFEPYQDTPDAVASRQWYKTAAARSHQFDNSDPLIPCRLPGHFSARGDWFLAAFVGSRSERMANQAIDLLCSRRSNALRMQMGLGLPTRSVPQRRTSQSATVQLFTLRNGQRSRVQYDELCSLGGRSAEEIKADPDLDSFFWLWRSSIGDYDRHANVWLRWLGRTLLFCRRIRTELGRDWTNGFDLAEQILNWGTASQGVARNPIIIGARDEFYKRCVQLREDLDSATERE